MNHKFKIKQRVAALCMAAMMCCSLFPVRAFAEAPRRGLVCGENHLCQ